MKRITWKSTAVNPPPKPTIKEANCTVTEYMPVLIQGKSGYYNARIVKHIDEHSYWQVQNCYVLRDDLITHFLDLGKLPNE